MIYGYEDGWILGLFPILVDGEQICKRLAQSIFLINACAGKCYFVQACNEVAIHNVLW